MAKIMEEREDNLVTRYNIATLETMTVEAENEARRLRGEAPLAKGGVNVPTQTEEEKKQAEQTRQDKLLAAAQTMLQAGQDPKIVAQFLLGLPTQPTTGFQPTGGMQFSDLLAMLEFMRDSRKGESSESPALLRVIDALEKKMERIEGKLEGSSNHQPVDPIEQIERVQEHFSRWRQLLIESGTVVDPRTIKHEQPVQSLVQRGGTLEEIRERNRHDEKMAELGQKQKHDQELLNVVASIPEALGRGAASQVREAAGIGTEPKSAKRTQDNGDMQVMKCVKCGESIYISPETGTEIQCGKCGEKYHRERIATRDEIDDLAK